MTLIDVKRAAALYRDIGQSVEVSGGSGANTIVGAASFGGDVAFVWKVRNDRLGDAFTADIRAAGALFETSPLTGGPATARCVIMVSPDGDTDLVGRAKVTYLEGYLWDPHGPPRRPSVLPWRRAHARAIVRSRSPCRTRSAWYGIGSSRRCGWRPILVGVTSTWPMCWRARRSPR